MDKRFFTFQQYYLPGKPDLPLAVACELAADGSLLRACVTDQCDQLRYSPAASLDELAADLAVAVLDFSKPWHLQPVHIPKPWGQEIWFTGIEARGVSFVVSDTGSTPLSWAIAIDQQRILGAHAQPNLLKILDPLPDEVFGDLYFELHEEKREVYIVTHVDEKAWPEGVGAIRLGFSPEKRAEFATDAGFLDAYRAAVKGYRAVRSDIDARLDACRLRENVGLNDPASTDMIKQWLGEVPVSLQQRERELRHAMDAFTAMRDLRVGDVLPVPLRTPHALQHGVRTVEFQTPVYERKILSFAQKVLTQEDWDTDEALHAVSLSISADDAFPVIRDSDGVRIETIVQFDDFTVQRIYLQPDASWPVVVDGDYALLMSVTGLVLCSGQEMAAEQALLVPCSAVVVTATNPGASAVELLLARPL